ncbi:hypothetical protein J3R83DRAFT_6208 [Lanmaoa asiatica]|nr:hypothetical protein J3R83DRAFT_6208 [Lanmaoa asiatica]
MRFAPPSPTTLPAHQVSPTYPHSDNSSSSVALSSMMFAPPSPSVECVPPTRLQPLSGPPSPYSPLEFAPPPSPPPDVIDKHSLPQHQSWLSNVAESSSQRSAPCLCRHILFIIHCRLYLLRRISSMQTSEQTVFGGTASSLVFSAGPQKLHSPSFAALLTKQKNHRHAVSVSVSLKASGMKTEPSTPWQTDGLWLYVNEEEDGTAAKGPLGSYDLIDLPDAASTRSFIDLSDEEICDDDMSGFSFLAPTQNKCQRLHHSSSTPSLVESLDSEAQAEVERRRKREKLARLHRFLGSRVPPEAVTGCVFGPPLPPLAIPEEINCEYQLRGNKNASPGDFDRGKEELDEREKALNVRRAQKMERVFGTPPPQTLFHTRPSRPTVPVSQPTSPTGLNPYVLTLDIPSSSRNPNQSAYTGKTAHRRGPSDSSRCLLPCKEFDTPQSSPSSFAQSFADSLPESLSGFQEVLAQSCVYLNYQRSLNSLVDIIDRVRVCSLGPCTCHLRSSKDDRKSLVELHRFLHGEVDESPLEEEVLVDPRRASIATSFRSERRHSLPSNASMTSLSSEFRASPKVSLFQIRRRKATKLTNFFGVDYRELIHDILESVEKGVEEERRRGALRPQEVEVLLHRVRSLRTMQDPFPC